MHQALSPLSPNLSPHRHRGPHGPPSVIRYLFAGEKSACAAMCRHDAFRRGGGGRKRFGVGGERLRQKVGVPRHEIRAADENVAAERDDDAQRRFVDIGERRLGEKERLGAVGLHDGDVLLIGRDENADAPGIRSTDELGARSRQIARQHIDHGCRERAAPLIVPLSDDQEMIAPVNRPHAVGVEVGQHGPLCGEHASRPST